MSITYTNRIKNALDGLEKLIEAEFNIPVMEEHKGNESFVINPVSDELIENLSSGQARSYSVSIVYTMVQGETFTLVKDHLTNRAERLKRLLFNNNAYNDGNYVWHDGRVLSIDYSQNEDDQQMWSCELLYSLTITEVY